MAITFKSVGHFFATVYEVALGDIGKAESTAGVVEKVSAIVPVYGPLAVSVEKAGYAVLGELSAVLSAGGSAAKSKLTDAGLDQNVIATVEALMGSIPQITAIAKTL